MVVIEARQFFLHGGLGNDGQVGEDSREGDRLQPQIWEMFLMAGV